MLRMLRLNQLIPNHFVAIEMSPCLHSVFAALQARVASLLPGDNREPELIARLQLLQDELDREPLVGHEPRRAHWFPLRPLRGVVRQYPLNR